METEEADNLGVKDYGKVSETCNRRSFEVELATQLQVSALSGRAVDQHFELSLTDGDGLALIWPGVSTRKWLGNSV